MALIPDLQEGLLQMILSGGRDMSFQIGRDSGGADPRISSASGAPTSAPEAASPTFNPLELDLGPEVTRRQQIFSAIADALSTYGAGRAGNPALKTDFLGDLAERRQSRQQREQQLALLNADREQRFNERGEDRRLNQERFEAVQTAATEREQRARTERQEARVEQQKFQTSERKAREEFQRKQAEARQTHEKELRNLVQNQFSQADQREIRETQSQIASMVRGDPLDPNNQGGLAALVRSGERSASEIVEAMQNRIKETYGGSKLERAGELALLQAAYPALVEAMRDRFATSIDDASFQPNDALYHRMLKGDLNAFKVAESMFEDFSREIGETARAERAARRTEQTKRFAETESRLAGKTN